MADPAVVEERRSGLAPSQRVVIQFSLGLSDFLGTYLAFAGAGMLHGLSVGGGATVFATIAPVMVVAIAMLTGSYDRMVIGRPAVSAGRGVRALVYSVLAIIVLLFAAKASHDVSRISTVGGLILASCAMVVTRIVFALHVKQLGGNVIERKLLIEDGRSVPGMSWARRIDARALGLQPDADDPVTMSRIGEVVHRMDRVVVACPADKRKAWAALLKSFDAQCEIVDECVDNLGVIGASRVGGHGTLVISAHPLAMHSRLLKRGFDMIVAASAIVMCLPLFAVVALAILLEDGGPVFFRQQRMGQGNRTFDMFKFRSMGVAQCDHAAAQLTRRGDARVTRVGRFIRATSMDELPQLLNVLKGEMSIVGPRPHAAMAKAGDKLYWQVDRRYWERHALKPGLTGLAQVRGHRGATEREEQLSSRLQADLEYLDGWSIWRDLRIVAATARVLVHPQAF
ncbi:sugar transferase [Croceicoccus bisphenolivorans]|uniref:sugar transferase n=1 Tax=Croceicoccus bisphenolivorans TaxID=1783232 RepID=UPI001C12A0AB|nr:sugar transferase [Croceicoccus bisphenolivorans]